MIWEKRVIKDKEHLTLSAFGCFIASLYRESAAKCNRLTSKSKEGPISSISTRGVFDPDFFNNTLQIMIYDKHF